MVRYAFVNILSSVLKGRDLSFATTGFLDLGIGLFAQSSEIHPKIKKTKTDNRQQYNLLKSN